MPNRVLMLRWGDSAYDSLRSILDIMGREYAALGMEVLTADLSDSGWPKKMAERLQQTPAQIFQPRLDRV